MPDQGGVFFSFMLGNFLRRRCHLLITLFYPLFYFILFSFLKGSVGVTAEGITPAAQSFVCDASAKTI